MQPLDRGSMAAKNSCVRGKQERRGERPSDDYISNLSVMFQTWLASGSVVTNRDPDVVTSQNNQI